MTAKTLISAVLLVSPWLASASSDSVIDGEFEIQPYELMYEGSVQGFRHMTAAVNEERNEVILFGGISGSPSAEPRNSNVYTLDLTKPPSQQNWQYESTDLVVPRPWFTSTRGFIQFDDEYYVACHDADEDSVYAFNPNEYLFEHLSTSDLASGGGPSELDAGDCVAVGVTIYNSRYGNQNKEKRIYIIGGRNDYYSPVKAVRYYSITFNQWKRVADLNVGRSHLGAVSVERKGKPFIYVIGGGNSTDGVTLRSMEIYDVIKDKWTLYDDYFPEGEGRTRLGIQNIDNKYLLLIGGDMTCASGACPSDQPVPWVDMIDIKSNQLISDHNLIPQLVTPRQTPATVLRKRKGNNQQEKYVLYVIGGAVVRGEEGRQPLSTTEVLSFDRINVQNLKRNRRHH